MVFMIRRALALLVVGSALGLMLGAILDGTALGEEVPNTLREAPAPPSTKSKNLSRPFIEATKKVRPAVVKIYNMRRYRGVPRRGPTGRLCSDACCRSSSTPTARTTSCCKTSPFRETTFLAGMVETPLVRLCPTACTTSSCYYASAISISPPTMSST